MPFWSAPDRGKAVELALEPVSEGAAGSSSGAEGERSLRGDAQAGCRGIVVDPLSSPMAVDMSADSSEKSGENPAVKEARVPYAPSREEYDKHCVTHYPYRAW